jgi:plastocyanin
MNPLTPALALIGVLLCPAGWAADVRVDIKTFMFGPTDLTIAAGTRVTWVNDDQTPHTVVETNKLFRSAALDTQDSFSYTFDQPGTYKYFCALHPQMVGTITVGGPP